MNVAHFHARPVFPAREPPRWAPLVERWYQLDEAAFLLADAFASFGIALRPERLFLACAGASNATDHAFASGGATSPAKFVHTLPNVRASALLAVMGWNGSVLTLQRGAFTLGAAFHEAASHEGESWVWSLVAGKVDLFVFNGAPERATHELRRRERGEPVADMAILRSFWDSGASLDLEHWVVRKK